MFRLFVVVVAFAVAGTARAESCIAPTFDAPNNVALPVGEALPEGQGWVGGVGGDTKGSLRWFPAPNPDPSPGCEPYQIEVASSDRQTATDRPFLAEDEDADATSWRLPSDVNGRGDHVIFTTFADGATIADGPPTTGTAPTLGSLTTQKITKAGGCGGAVGSTATLISAPATAATDAQLLLDAWIVPQGDPRPTNDAPRAADKFPIALVDGQLFFRVEAEGAFTVFVQLTDAATAQSSAIVQIDFENPKAATNAVPTGCTASRCDGVLLSSALLLCFASRRRRTERRTQRVMP